MVWATEGFSAMMSFKVSFILQFFCYFNSSIRLAAGPHRGRLAPHQRPLAAAIRNIPEKSELQAFSQLSPMKTDVQLPHIFKRNIFYPLQDKPNHDIVALQYPAHYRNEIPNRDKNIKRNNRYAASERIKE
jgi:hypothetical protein